MKTYIKALLILVIYVILTRAEFLAMVLYPNTAVALIIPTVVASISGVSFLYFFTHKDIFRSAKVIIERKKKAEEKLLDKFLRFGAIGAAIIIGYIAGPLFCALTVYLLLSSYKYKYQLTLFVSASSSFLAICIARGMLQLLFKLR